MKKLAVIAVVLALTGCANSQTHSTHSISQNNVTAISVDASTQFSVKRVVVLANGVAEIMNSLNARSIFSIKL